MAWLITQIGGAVISIAVFLAILWAFILLIGVLYTFFISAFLETIKFEDILNNSAVVTGWTLVRDVCNMFFVVVLLVIAIATILHIESYSWKRMLPKLLLMAILINFSMTICGALVDVSQIIMLTFAKSMGSAAAGNFVEAFGIEKMLTVRGSLSSGLVVGAKLIGGTAKSGITANNDWLLSGLRDLLLTFGLLAIAFIIALTMWLVLAFRIVAIWVLVILSPLAFAASVLPATSKWAGQWWGHFGKYLFVGPAIAFFTWLALMVTAEMKLKSSANPATFLFGAETETFSEMSDEEAIKRFFTGETEDSFIVSAGDEAPEELDTGYWTSQSEEAQKAFKEARGTNVGDTEAGSYWNLLKYFFSIVLFAIAILAASQFGAAGAKVGQNMLSKTQAVGGKPKQWLNKVGAKGRSGFFNYYQRKMGEQDRDLFTGDFWRGLFARGKRMEDRQKGIQLGKGAAIAETVVQGDRTIGIRWREMAQTKADDALLNEIMEGYDGELDSRHVMAFLLESLGKMKGPQAKRLRGAMASKMTERGNTDDFWSENFIAKIRELRAEGDENPELKEEKEAEIKKLLDEHGLNEDEGSLLNVWNYDPLVIKKIMMGVTDTHKRFDADTELVEELEDKYKKLSKEDKEKIKDRFAETYKEAVDEDWGNLEEGKKEKLKKELKASFPNVKAESTRGKYLMLEADDFVKKGTHNEEEAIKEAHHVFEDVSVRTHKWDQYREMHIRQPGEKKSRAENAIEKAMKEAENAPYEEKEKLRYMHKIAQRSLATGHYEQAGTIFNSRGGFAYIPTTTAAYAEQIGEFRKGRSLEMFARLSPHVTKNFRVNMFGKNAGVPVMSADITDVLPAQKEFYEYLPEGSITASYRMQPRQYETMVGKKEFFDDRGYFKSNRAKARYKKIHMTNETWTRGMWRHGQYGSYADRRPSPDQPGYKENWASVVLEDAPTMLESFGQNKAMLEKNRDETNDQKEKDRLTEKIKPIDRKIAEWTKMSEEARAIEKEGRLKSRKEYEDLSPSDKASVLHEINNQEITRRREEGLSDHAISKNLIEAVGKDKTLSKAEAETIKTELQTRKSQVSSIINSMFKVEAGEVRGAMEGPFQGEVINPLVAAINALVAMFTGGQLSDLAPAQAPKPEEKIDLNKMSIEDEGFDDALKGASIEDLEAQREALQKQEEEKKQAPSEPAAKPVAPELRTAKPAKPLEDMSKEELTAIKEHLGQKYENAKEAEKAGNPVQGGADIIKSDYEAVEKYMEDLGKAVAPSATEEDTETTIKREKITNEINRKKEEETKRQEEIKQRTDKYSKTESKEDLEKMIKEDKDVDALKKYQIELSKEKEDKEAKFKEDKGEPEQEKDGQRTEIEALEGKLKIVDTEIKGLDQAKAAVAPPPASMQGAMMAMLPAIMEMMEMAQEEDKKEMKGDPAFDNAKHQEVTRLLDGILREVGGEVGSLDYSKSDNPAKDFMEHLNENNKEAAALVASMLAGMTQVIKEPMERLRVDERKLNESLKRLITKMGALASQIQGGSAVDIGKHMNDTAADFRLYVEGHGGKHFGEEKSQFEKVSKDG